jgi:hypothetical protein
MRRNKEVSVGSTEINMTAVSKGQKRNRSIFPIIALLKNEVEKAMTPPLPFSFRLSILINLSFLSFLCCLNI